MAVIFETGRELEFRIMGEASSKQTSSQPPEANQPANVHSGVNPSSSEIPTEEKEHHRDTEECRKVFKVYYAKLCDSIHCKKCMHFH